MKFIKASVLSLLALGFAGAANAITVDGTRDAAYGAPTATVGYDPLAPESNFGAPTGFSDTTGYQIYLTEQGGAVYGFLQASGPNTSLSFANLYFDIDPQNNNGSDIGFEVTNNRAFVAGVSGYSTSLPGFQFAVSSDGTGIEFEAPDSLFTSPIPGLTYDPAQVFAAPGGPVVLRLSQSFGYSVAVSPQAEQFGVGLIKPTSV